MAYCPECKIEVDEDDKEFLKTVEEAQSHAREQRTTIGIWKEPDGFKFGTPAEAKSAGRTILRFVLQHS